MFTSKEDVVTMMSKNVVPILIVSLLLVLMAGCGGGGMDMPQNVSDNNGSRLVSITVTPANPTIAKDTMMEFTATGIYSDNTTQNLTEIVTWSSSDQDVATIGVYTDAVTGAPSGNGKGHAYAHGKGTGKTNIKATSGDTSGGTELTVTDATLVSIAVTPSNPTIAEGEELQFSATGTFSDGTTQDLTTTATWLSSDTGVALISNVISSQGLVTSVLEGTTTITAEWGSVSGMATLTVAIATTGSVTLTWDAPTTNADGTPLFDLAGYKIYFGTSSRNYPWSIDVGNVTTYKLNNLSPGTYFFAVTANNTSGIESDFSVEVSKTLE